MLLEQQKHRRPAAGDGEPAGVVPVDDARPAGTPSGASPAAAALPPGPPRRRRRLFENAGGLLLVTRRLWLLLSVLGPGIIAANADNDASGIFGYSLAGAQYRYEMLWVLVISTFALGIAQEICARMGAITGRGLADLIREEYGVKVALFAMGALLVANFATTVSEFAGILAGAQVFLPPFVSRFVVVPLLAAGVWWLVTRGSYRRLEKVLLGASLIYLLYIVSAFLAHPDWSQVLRSTVRPDPKVMHPLRDYVFMIVNVIGTTITPWGQFYIQSSVRDKGVKPAEYPLLRADVLFGAFFTNLVAFFIVVCCGATLWSQGIHTISDAGQAAQSLAPVAGRLASLLFVVGLVNASLFGAIAVPLSTAYAVTESLGWESGVGRKRSEAPLFVGMFTFLVAASALLVMLFPRHLTTLILLPNVVGALLLPIILVLMLLLVNKRRLMGRHVNGPVYNFAAWTITVVLIVLSVVLLVTHFLPMGK